MRTALECRRYIRNSCAWQSACLSWLGLGLFTDVWLLQWQTANSWHPTCKDASMIYTPMVCLALPLEGAGVLVWCHNASAPTGPDPHRPTPTHRHCPELTARDFVKHDEKNKNSHSDRQLSTHPSPSASWPTACGVLNAAACERNVIHESVKLYHYSCFRWGRPWYSWLNIQPATGETVEKEPGKTHI